MNEVNINQEQNFDNFLKEPSAINELKTEYFELKKLREICPGFSIVSQNARSVQQNEPALNELISQSQPDVACLQEVWLGGFCPKGYDMVELTRREKRGGGVAILYKEELNPKLIFKHIDNNLETIAIELPKQGIICSTYLPPKGSNEEALNKL